MRGITCYASVGGISTGNFGVIPVIPLPRMENALLKMKAFLSYLCSRIRLDACGAVRHYEDRDLDC